mmetsp:Transcript_30118/g.69098  ORF Transcript_30118/g.69098 Transcript_30118/m.69098 type:complete len:96 (+) Transcript_30118:321-608(+)
MLGMQRCGRAQQYPTGKFDFARVNMDHASLLSDVTQRSRDPSRKSMARSTGALLASCCKWHTLDDNGILLLFHCAQRGSYFRSLGTVNYYYSISR